MSGAVMAASPRGRGREGPRTAGSERDAGYRRPGGGASRARTITPSEDPGVLTVTGETSPTLRSPTR